MALPAVARAHVGGALRSWPGMGRSSWMRSWKGPTEARSPSRLMAPMRSAESRSASPSATARQPMAAMNCVPLRRLRPSLASSESGARPAAGSAGAGRLARAVLRQQLALAHHSEHEVRRRREVAGGAQRAARGHPRDEVGVEHRGHETRRLPGAHARVAARHGVEADGHGGAHDLARERRAHADGVTAHQVLLQLVDLVDRDVRGGQLAEAGGDAVGDLLLGDDARDDVVGARRCASRAARPRVTSAPPRATATTSLDAERRVADDDLRHSARLLSRCRRSNGTTSGGADATGMPAASSAVFFSAAVPDEPSTMAPA